MSEHRDEESPCVETEGRRTAGWMGSAEGKHLAGEAEDCLVVRMNQGENSGGGCLQEGL